MSNLQIISEDGEVIVSVKIGDVVASDALVAILNALTTLPKPRKPRSDRGKTKEKANV